jgi:hypothetical protein
MSIFNLHASISDDCRNFVGHLVYGAVLGAIYGRKRQPMSAHVHA